MRLKASIAAAVMLALLAGGCGGDEGSAGDYQAELDGLCADQQALLLELPQRQADEDLTTEEIQEIAEGYAADFRAEFEDLEPPGDLEEAHDDLGALVSEDPDPDASVEEVIAFYDEIAVAYDEVGATGCADGVREGSERFQEAAENLPPVDPQD